jgi:cellulose biosynthesis protein BcsQ
VLDIVKPILEGDASINKNVRPLSASGNRFGVAILPGHPQLSMMEGPLSFAWTELPSGKPGGFRTSNWLRAYLEGLESDYDFAFVDVSPSLGAINRSALLACSHFVTPLGADAFSILGLRNISRWMGGWIEYYKVGLQQSERLNPGGLEKFRIRKDVPIETGFVGYTLQQYIAKSKSGKRRPTKAYERILRDLPKEVEKFMLLFSVQNYPLEEYHLGDVPNLYSLIPLAQTANAPIVALKAKDGLVGVSSIKPLITKKSSEAWQGEWLKDLADGWSLARQLGY